MAEITEEVIETTTSAPQGNGLIETTQDAIISGAEKVSEAVGAAGKTVAEAASQPFYTEVEFWVGMAFVLSVIVLYKPLWKYIKQALRNRINKVVSDIDEAAKLRDDAQVLLADYERRFKNAGKEAEQILNTSRKNIQNMKDKELAALKNDLSNKEKETARRIAAANVKAADEINAYAGDMSVGIAREAVKRYLQSADKSKLIDEAIADLDKFAV